MALGAMQTIVIGGLAPSYATPGSSENITPTDNLFLHVKNGSGSSITVTLTDAGTTPSGSAATNPTVTVPATTGDRMIYLPRTLASPTTGYIVVGFSATTSVTAALLRL
jgi:hypothetical protein